MGDFADVRALLAAEVGFGSAERGFVDDSVTGDFDPLLAEYVIVQSAGGKVSGTHGRMRRFYATLRLLRVLVADLELDREGIDQLLREGRALADEWLGQR